MKEPTGNLMKIQVSDTGSGIKKINADSLLQPFSQHEADTSPLYGKTGLGIPISKLLVQLMGGTIGFTTEENIGTCFWFTIPVPVEKSNLNKMNLKQSA